MSKRVVVITGASSGIGLATARRFVDAGDTVFNLDISPPVAETDSGAIWRECDVSDGCRVASRLSDILIEEGGVDVAIANAGISIRRPFLQMTPAEVMTLMSINFLGVVNLWQAAGRHMYAAKSGCLLATASTNGNVRYPHYADYNASKAAVLSLCKTAALELAPHVRTACVSPGYVMTPMQRQEYTDEMINSTNLTIPAGRHAAPEEIASAFRFLASKHANYITGQQLIVDGGELAGGTASGYRTQAEIVG